MASQRQAGRVVQPGRMTAGPIFWTGLVLVAAATSVLHLPRDAFEPDEVIVLPNAGVQPEQGLAWILPIETELPSNKEAHSPLRMFEDGLELRSNSVHDQIRQQGGAQFSHWGPWIRFSTTDGSDPRTNGREYTLLAPGTERPWLAPSVLGLLVVAVVLTAFGGWSTARASHASRVQLAGVLLVIAALVSTAWRHWDWIRWTSDLAAVHADLSADDELLVARARGFGNTTRLMSEGAGRIRFIPLAERPPGRALPTVTFSPEEGVESRDGRSLLRARGPGLVGELARPVGVRDLAEIVLPIRITEGERLLVEFFRSLDDLAPLDRVELPVIPEADLQHLRVRRPLVGYVGVDQATVGAIRLSNPTPGSPPLAVSVGAMVLADPMAVFGRDTHGTERLEIDRSTRPCFWQSVAGEVVMPWPPDAGRLLKGSVAALGRRGNDPVGFSIEFEDHRGRRHPLVGGQTAARHRWSDLRVDLPEGSEPTAIVLVCPQLSPDTVLAWSGWRVVDTSRPPRRVLLTLMDTLRADALACYGNPTSATPHLDALAREGVRFARAYSQAFCTRPSMPSIMTGRYVATTGVESITQHLPGSYVTLAEAFAGAGFYTVADISNTNAGPDVGLDQGFDEMKLVLQGPMVPDTASYLGEHVLPHLAGLQEEDLLAYVHLMEAHGPYGTLAAPAEPYQAPPGEPLARDPYLDRAWVGAPSDASRIDLYHADVESMDRGFGEFLELLLGRWEQDGGPETVVAVMSDHGEFLGEYGQWGHSYFRLVPEINHVPLILRAPELPAGVVCDVPVENIDVAPTLLALAGLAPSDLGEIEGRSLLPLVREGDESGHGRALASSGGHAGGLLSVFGSRGVLVGVNDKLVGQLHADGRSRGDPALAPALRPDARDSLIVSALQSGLETDFEELWARYLESRAALRRPFWTDEDTNVSSLDPLALQHLRAMGYLDR